MAGKQYQVVAEFITKTESFVQGLNRMRQMTQSFNQRLNQGMASSQTAINGLTRHLNNVSSALNMNSDVNRLTSSLDELGDSSQDISRLNDELEDMSDNMGEADSGSVGFIGTLESMKAGALALVGGIAAVGIGLGAMVKQGDDLQQALNSLQMQTGATDDEMKGMEDSLVSIYGAGYGESFDDIAQAMANIKQSTQLAGDELKEATQDALLFRDSFGIEVPESTKTVSVMMKQFGITSKEAFTLLAQGQQQGLNFSDDMMDSFNEYSVYFKQLGFDAEGMWDVFKAGADGGAFNLDKVGDSIKELGIRVKDGSKTSIQAFTDLGFNADDMSAKFAAGGDSAQEALGSLFNELGKIEDPVKRNTIGVNLFGTQFEDLEYKTIQALGNVRSQADMTADTLDKMDELKFNSIGGAIAGTWRIIQTSLLIPLEQKMMPALNKGANFIKDNLPKAIATAKQAFEPFKQAIQGVWALFQGDIAGGASILAKLGLSPEQIGLVLNMVNMIKTYVGVLVNYWKTAFAGIKIAVSSVFSFLLPYITPILTSVFTFISQKLTQLKTFWDQNGAMILQAVRNLFTGIMAVVQFIMPAVLFIINMVWGNIKGVISGALNIIMGVVKIFAGLFTGNFSAMWSGIKQLFVGAVQFLWNLINLMMLGRIFSVIKSFGVKAISSFKVFWNGAKSIFQNLESTVSSIVSKLVSRALGFFRNLYTQGSRIFNMLRTFGATVFNALRQAVVNIIGNLVRSAVQFFTRLYTSARTQFNNLLSAAKSIFGKLKSAISQPVQTAKDFIINTFKNIKLSSIGKDIVQGLINGISSMIGNVKAKVKEIASAIPDGVKKFLNIKSPSRVMKKLGGYVSQGLAIGIDKDSNLVSKATKSLSNIVQSVNVSAPSVNTGILKKVANTDSGQESSILNTSKSVTFNLGGVNISNTKDADDLVNYLEKSLKGLGTSL